MDSSEQTPKQIFSNAVRLERIRHQQALDSQILRQEFDRAENSLKLQFERDKAAYEQNGQHLRSLNQFLWQVPTIAITLTGGLWYGVTKVENTSVQTGMLWFCALADLLFLVIVARVRHLFGQFLEAQTNFNQNYNIKKENGPFFFPTWTVVFCFMIMLISACLGSGVGALYVEKLGPSPAKHYLNCNAE